MQIGRPQPFFATALEHQTTANFDDVEYLTQVCMVSHKNSSHLIFFSDSKNMARVAFNDDVDIEQFSINTMVVLKSFTSTKKSNGLISMELRDWEIVGHGVKMYGPPAKLLPTNHGENSSKDANANNTDSDANAKATTDESTKSHSVVPSGGVNGNVSNDRPARASNGEIIITVESLSPYISKVWQVQVRATRKSDIREYTRQSDKQVGKVFNITFTDETGEIQATGFGDAAVANFYDEIIEGQTYNISRFTVRGANKAFNKSGHDSELSFNRDSVVEHVPNATVESPKVFFKFVDNFAKLPNVEIDSNIDVIGVISQMEPLQSSVSKSNIPYTKRDVHLVDDSMKTITLTLWGADAENFHQEVGTVLAVKAVRLSSFKGSTLSATRAARSFSDPDHPRAHQLKGWYQAANGANSRFENVADDPMANDSGAGQSKSERQRTTIAEAYEQRLGYSEQSDYFTIKARISSVNQRTVAYPSCTNGDCKKKVVEDGNQWRCEKCQVYMDAPRYRFMLSMLIDDPSSPKTGMQISVFDDIGRQLYGDTAQELQEMKSFGAPQDYNRDLATKLHNVKGNEYIWDIRGTLETYNGEERPRFSAMNMKKVNTEQEGLRMLSEMGV